MAVVKERIRLRQILTLITEVEGRLEFLKEKYTDIFEEYGELVDTENNLFNLRKSILHSDKVLKMLTNLKNNYQSI